MCNSTSGNVSDDFCHAIALLARMLCTEELVDPKSIEALVACWLIPLDKSPSVRPIGVGEVLRRVIGKAILTVLKSDILNFTGYQQLCTGLESGCEVAVHAVVDLFEEDVSHGFIQIDTSNAFNLINWTLILHNVRILCPEIATYINNCYMKHSRLFITGGKEIWSNERTTQGDPIAVGMYALGLTPLLSSINSNNTVNLIDVAFADDLTSVGKLHELIEWWKNVLHYGPYLGYYVNESKSWLIIKEEYIQIAKETFPDYNIKITTNGHRHLGAVVGANENKEVFVIAKLSKWIKQLKILTKFACTEPHAAFSGFIHRLRHRYKYFMRTVPGISHLLKPLDDAIDTFIKVLLQWYTFNPTERVLFSLPAKYGAMGLIIPSKICP